MLNYTKILGVESILIYFCCLRKDDFAQFQMNYPEMNRKEKKLIPKKPSHESCNSEALSNVSSEYTVKVQNFQASSLLFTVWELKLSGSYSPQKRRRMDPATNWDN